MPQSLTDCRRLSQKGVAALERGEQPKAETLLAQAVNACPVDAEARRHYAEASGGGARQQEAMTQLEEACRLAGEDASLWARLGEMRLAGGQPGIGPTGRRNRAEPRSQAGQCLGDSRGGDASDGPGVRRLGRLSPCPELRPERSGDSPRNCRTSPPIEPTGSGPPSPANAGGNLPRRGGAGPSAALDGLSLRGPRPLRGRRGESFGRRQAQGDLRRRCFASLARPNSWPATRQRLPRPRGKPWP